MFREQPVLGDLGKRLVGQRYESEWLVVDQPLVDKFAEATSDHQYIHVDPVRAAKTQFGGTIAHGFLLLSLLPRLHALSGRPVVEDVEVSLNYGFDRVRFVTPVIVGSRVRALFEIVDLIEKRPGEYQQFLDIVLEIEGVGNPAIIARWISLFAVQRAP